MNSEKDFKDYCAHLATLPVVGGLERAWGHQGYEYEIRWGTNRFAVRSEDSLAAAKQSCIAWATKHGWTPPKWWQFWRWNDTRP